MLDRFNEGEFTKRGFHVVVIGCDGERPLWMTLDARVDIAGVGQVDPLFITVVSKYEKTEAASTGVQIAQA